MKIGIVTFGDGRKRVTERMSRTCFGFQSEVTAFLRRLGHKVVEGDAVVHDAVTIKSQSEKMLAAGIDALVCNFAIWSYPDFTAQVVKRVGAPTLLLGNLNPGYPGWVAFFASAGALGEIGYPFGRALGDIQDPTVGNQVKRWLHQVDPDQRAQGVRAAKALHGMRYGRFDGPSMGMYTGHIDASQWLNELGVHVFHRGQFWLWEKSKTIDPERVEAGLKWLEENCKEVRYDGKKLTPGLDGTLARQVRLYLSIKDFCREEGLDFCGLTGQLDFTELSHACIMDVPEALLNDNTDWEEEKKKPLICATECDSNGALTMQIMHLITGTPVLFADLRHYFAMENVYDLVNSGQHAPWLARRSENWRENWKQVRLFPSLDFYFIAGGASVQFYADPAPMMTLGRITRVKGLMQFHILTAELPNLGWEKMEELARQTTYEWPHVFARFHCPPETLGNTYFANHIHGVIGDHVAALVAAGEHLGMKVTVLS